MRPVLSLALLWAAFAVHADEPPQASQSALCHLLVDGPTLHASLATRLLDDRPMRHVPREVVRENPQLSAEPGFLRAIAASGSQGRLDARGIGAALYALYAANRDLGFYGLQAQSAADADRIEGVLREAWAHNIQIHRARVHRAGLALGVVWHDGVEPEVWEAANAVVARRLQSVQGCVG